MKTINKILILGIAFLIILSFDHCSKVVLNSTANLPALKPVSTDSSAGGWKTILLTSPSQISVAIPVASSSSSYLAELVQIKASQVNLTSDQKASISYWSAGNVLRWNETMRDLVAKYNLAPVTVNGVYPIPNPTNPLAYPLFPFSNPPYSSRAYAYVSAAQYDALVAAYYYKSLYNRKAPYFQDPGVNALVPKSSLASYPSEAGVLAGVTAEMMKLLFPDEVISIQAKAHNAEQSAILSGAATQSDINAGDSLGKHIADLFIARAKKDRAGAAVGNATIWAALATNAKAKNQVPWISLEVPQRPPQLPLFGNVKSLILDSLTLLSLRPGPPPSTSSDSMASQLNKALKYIQNPTPENIRITQFWADGIGTYTPPGHWNTIAATDFITQNYSEIRWARNFAILNISMMDAAIVCWNTKYFYFNPRPTQMNNLIKTLTGIPNFPSYISGHSTLSGAACTVLGYLIPSRVPAYVQMASEASNSRTVSGIHYEIDCTTGLRVGVNIGNLAVQKLKTLGGN